MKMMSHQNICTAVQYHFYGVVRLAWVCDKAHFASLIATQIPTVRRALFKTVYLSVDKYYCLILGQVICLYGLLQFTNISLH
jgi:hypothetical protein